MHRIFTLTLLAAALAGCVNLAPDYVRPALPVAASVDGTAAIASAATLPAWQDLVSDARLQQVVALALANNRDLRVAALNVDKAQATYRIADAARYPAIKANGSDSISSAQDSITRKYTAGLGFSSYEIDFFGRLKNLSDAGLESFLASAASQRSARLSLIAEVADGWLTLAANQDLLRLAQKTWQSRQQTLALTRQQQALGSVSALTLAQQEASAEAAHDDVANYTSQVEQSLNALTVLVGTAIPADLLPAATDTVGTSAARLIDLPAGLASEVLLARPDIVAAEHTLKATYADIGAARAAFFPNIALTASTGTASTSLDGLFKAGTGTWAFAPTLSVPIFNAGSLRASLDSAKIAKEIQVATYEKAIQTAFREVADALAVRRVLAERLDAQQKQVTAYAKSLELTTALYRAGSSSYLDVLDAQRSLYAAQKSLIALQLTEQSNRLTLFKVLGGA